MKNLSLAILAGGKGSRIKQFSNRYPKPMVKINNIHFLQYLINIYTKYPIDKIYILTGYKSDIIFKKFHNKTFNFTKVICLKEKKFMGTGGALFKLKSKVKDFILINGDTIFDINLNDFFKSISKKKIGSLALTSMDKNTNNYKLNNLSINSGTLIYKRKSMLMNGGVYFFRKKIFRYLKNKPLSLENELLPKLIQNKKLTAKKYKNFFLDIGTPKYMRSSHKKIKKYF